MGTGIFYSYSDLYKLNNIVQSTHTVAIKQLIIAQLRDFFASDSYYHCVLDEFGFNKAAEFLGTSQDAGINDDVLNRVYISEYYKYSGIMYPSILVKSGSIKYMPLSINRERETITYDVIDVVDGYGNRKSFRTPKSFIFAGYWDSEINIDVLSRGIRSRDDLVELIQLLLSDLKFRELEQSGIVIKSVSAGSPTEYDDRNDKIYKQTINLSILSEWRREIPIKNIVDKINFCVEFAANLEVEPIVTAPNLEIHTQVNLIDSINDIII